MQKVNFMDAIGEISVTYIQRKYNLGFWYAQNVVNKLEEIGYIKKENEYRYKIIRTENEIDFYIKSHLEELRPQKYIDYGWKDNGEKTLKSKIIDGVEYAKITIPVYVRRILFSIPQVIILFFLTILFISIEKNDGDMDRLQKIFFVIYLVIMSYILFMIPLNIFIRLSQAKFYKMKFKDFMLLPKNWFFKRCRDTVELCAILKENNVKFHIGNYDSLIEQLGNILQKKKSLAEHYASIANNAENENEFYNSINSCISTLEWMSQFEKFDIFVESKPSEDIKAIKDGMYLSIERFNNRINNAQNRYQTNNPINRTDLYNKQYDYMEGHDFEYFCAELLKKNGFVNVDVTQGSGDHGIDILAEKDGISYAIQCKCYSSNIGNAAVQQAHTGKSLYHKDIAVVLTNRYFTPQAIEEAKALGVKLWDRDQLNKMIGF